jgi:hypothetical protein
MQKQSGIIIQGNEPKFGASSFTSWMAIVYLLNFRICLRSNLALLGSGE